MANKYKPMITVKEKTATEPAEFIELCTSPCGDGAEVDVGSEGTPVTGSLTISEGSINIDLGDELKALSNFNETGIISRTGVGQYKGRTLEAGNNISIANPDGIDGNPTISFTGSNGINSVGISGGTGLNVANSPLTSDGSIDLTLSPELENLSNYGGIGLVSRNSSGDYSPKTLVAGDNIEITEDGNNITINSTGGGGGSDIELIGSILGTSSNGVINTRFNTDINLGAASLINYNIDNRQYSLNYNLKMYTQNQCYFSQAIGTKHPEDVLSWRHEYELNKSSFSTSTYKINFYKVGVSSKNLFIISHNPDSQSTLFTLDGRLYINNNRIIGVASPQLAGDAVNKQYVDSKLTDTLTELKKIKTDVKKLRKFLSEYVPPNKLK